MMDFSEHRAALMAQLAELDGRLHDIEAALEAPHSKDWEEMAVEREGEEVLEALGHQGQEEILRIRAALGRLRDGTYGICKGCGDPISEGRLRALPDSPFCKNCTIY